MVAALLKRSCGATTDDSYQVAITRKNQKYKDTDVMFFVDNDIVFTADSDHGSAKAEPLAQLQWKDSRHLLIEYDKGARIFRQKQSHEELAISYKPLSPDELTTT